MIWYGACTSLCFGSKVKHRAIIIHVAQTVTRQAKTKKDEKLYTDLEWPNSSYNVAMLACA